MDGKCKVCGGVLGCAYCDSNKQAESDLLQRGVIFRCGWCGMPVDKDGAVLPNMNSAEDCNKYLDNCKDCTVELVNGVCCPNGDQDHARQDYRYQER